MKRAVASTLHRNNGGEQGMAGTGTFFDPQVIGAYSLYGDSAFETIVNALTPIMSKKLGKTVYPTYSYARIYTKGHELKRHKDRAQCEISTTLNLGGDKPWPIYINPKQEEGTWNNTTEKYIPSTSKGIKVDLKPGDMLLYRGNILEHWREPFIGNHCAQVFLHYNDVKTPGAEENALDKRPHLGLPNRIRRAEKKIP